MHNWEPLFIEKIRETSQFDPAHDLAHLKRVVKTTHQLTHEEHANPQITYPAAWFHDFINIPKNDPRRSIASRLSAEAAIEYLRSVHFADESILLKIAHAIEAHSYSANIEPQTLEAAIVQDADRLDGLGAIGIARVFTVGGLLQRKLYHDQNPFGEPELGTRVFNDLEFTLDHFYVKLFKTAQTLKTKSGQREGQRRVQIMEEYLSHLKDEILT
jgi:uncharacterized protein